MSDFYRDSDAFLYENIAFNRTRAKCRMRAWIVVARRLSRHYVLTTFGDRLVVTYGVFQTAGHVVGLAVFLTLTPPDLVIRYLVCTTVSSFPRRRSLRASSVASPIIGPSSAPIRSSSCSRPRSSVPSAA